MIQRFKGIAKELWEEECEYEEYVSPFVGKEYEIYTTNGTIIITNPKVVINSPGCNNERTDFLRVVINHDEVIDIPKSNILYVKEKDIEFIEKNENVDFDNEIKFNETLNEEDSKKFTIMDFEGNTVSRSFKLYESTQKKFMRFCKKHNRYRIQDIFCTLLMEAMKEYEE